MRAVVLREGQLALRDIPDPVPGEGQLLLRVRASAICASDVHFMDHPESFADDASGMFSYDPDADLVLGHEFVGEVIGHGPGASPGQFPIGTRVTSIPLLVCPTGGHIIGNHPNAPGAFAEQMLVSQDLARQVPDDIPDDAVALVDAFAVGTGYVRQAALTPNDIPLVIGAGAIGLSAVAALKIGGHGPIIVSDFNPDRLKRAVGFGADITVDPAQRSAFDVWADTAAARGGAARCVVFECVGAHGFIDKLVTDCPPHALISCAGGWYTGDTVNVSPATRKGVTVQFGGSPEFDDWYGTLDAVCARRLDPTPSIGMIIGLDGVPDAIDMARKAQGPPRIIVRP